jgi:hypothetical protein
MIAAAVPQSSTTEPTIFAAVTNDGPTNLSAALPQSGLKWLTNIVARVRRRTNDACRNLAATINDFANDRSRVTNEEPMTDAAWMPQPPTLLSTAEEANAKRYFHEDRRTCAALVNDLANGRQTMVRARLPQALKACSTIFAATSHRGLRETRRINQRMTMNANDSRRAFDVLIQQHVPHRPAKLRLLMEFRDSIAEARKKGASFEVIRTYLAKTAVVVSADTVARFCHQILSEPECRGSKRKRKTQASHQNGTTAADLLTRKRSTTVLPSHYQAPTGPRLVDPKSL